VDAITTGLSLPTLLWTFQNMSRRKEATKMSLTRAKKMTRATLISPTGTTLTRATLILENDREIDSDLSDDDEILEMIYTTRL
jgi:hypothetical protein